MSSIYSLFEVLGIRPNPNKTRSNRPYTADELSILSGWIDREISDHEIIDKFHDRTTSSVRNRLTVERWRSGSNIKPRLWWSSADDARLLALRADRPSTIDTAQLCRDVAPLFGRSVAGTIARLRKLQRAKQKKSSVEQNDSISQD